MKVHPIFIDLPWFFHTPVTIINCLNPYFWTERSYISEKHVNLKPPGLRLSQAHCIYAVPAVRMQGEEVCVLLPGLWSCISVKHRQCYSISFQTCLLSQSSCLSWQARVKEWDCGIGGNCGISEPCENSPQGTPTPPTRGPRAAGLT